MLAAISEYQELGGSLMYLGGGGFFWVTSFSDQWPGAIEVRKDMYKGGWRQYELRHAFDGAYGGRWEMNGRAPQALLGVGWNTFAGAGFAFEGSAPYRRLPDSYRAQVQFIFNGIGNEIIGDYGIFGGGAAGQEFDCVNSELGTPAHALHLARADKFPSLVSMLDEQYAMNASQPFGDIVYFETVNGGAVFSAASMTWVGSLSHNNYDNDVSRITENVLRRFMCDSGVV
jgi:N,N-dimethylformamidase